MSKEVEERKKLQYKIKSIRIKIGLSAILWIVYIVVSLLLTLSALKQFRKDVAISFAKANLDKPKVALLIVQKQIEKGIKYNKYDVKTSVKGLPKTEEELKIIKGELFRKIIKAIPTEFSDIKLSILSNNELIADSNTIEDYALAQIKLDDNKSDYLIENIGDVEKNIVYYENLDFNCPSCKCKKALVRYGFNESTIVIAKIEFTHDKIAFMKYDAIYSRRIWKHIALIIIGLLALSIFYFFTIRRKKREFELENTLQREKDKYKTFFNEAPYPIVVCDFNGKILEANGQAVELSGTTTNDLLTTNFSEFFKTEDLIEQPFQFEKINSVKSIQSQRDIVNKQGKEYSVLIKTRLLSESTFQTIIVDITEKQDLINEIQSKNELIQFSEEHANIGSMIYDIERNELIVSEGLKKLCGVDKSFEISKLEDYFSLISKEDSERILRNRKFLKKSDNGQFVIEYQLKKNDGKKVWVGHKEVFQSNANGKGHIYTSIKDIDEFYKKLEIELETTEKFKRIFDNAEIALLTLDARFVVDTLTERVKSLGDIDMIIKSLNDEIVFDLLRFSKIKDANKHASKLLNYSKIEEISLNDLIKPSEYKKITGLYRAVLELKKDYSTFLEVNINGKILHGYLNINIPADILKTKTLIASFSDVTQLYNVQRELENSNKTLTTYLDLTEQLVLVIDSDNKIHFVNKAFEEIFEVSSDKIKGKYLKEEFEIEDIETKKNKGKDTNTNKKLVEKIRKNKTERIVRWNIREIKGSENENNRLLLIGHDITDEGRNQDELRKSYKEIIRLKHKLEKQNQSLNFTKNRLEEREELLENENADKDKFFSIIAHDIRSPFTSILGLTQFLNDSFEEMSEENKLEAINTLYSGTRNVYNLIEDLLEWSRAKMNKIPFEPKKMGVFEIVTHSYLPFESALKNKNISFKKEIDKNLFVFADERSLLTIFRNLISNAIKFTRAGGEIEVTAKLDGKKIEIIIQDNGIGISSDVQEKIFKIDQHYTSAGTNNETGTGLGLILVQEFVQKNGGHVWVVSEQNIGSAFHFILPASK